MALHTTTQPLNDSDTANTQKDSELASEKYQIRCAVSCNVTHWIQPSVEYKEALYFSYHYRIISSIPQNLSTRTGLDWEGSSCAPTSVRINRSRLDEGGIVVQETQAVLRYDMLVLWAQKWACFCLAYIISPRKHISDCPSSKLSYPSSPFVLVQGWEKQSSGAYAINKCERWAACCVSVWGGRNWESSYSSVLC